jgi:hypothetical protein
VGYRRAGGPNTSRKAMPRVAQAPDERSLPIWAGDGRLLSMAGSVRDPGTGCLSANLRPHQALEIA